MGFCSELQKGRVGEVGCDTPSCTNVRKQMFFWEMCVALEGIRRQHRVSGVSDFQWKQERAAAAARECHKGSKAWAKRRGSRVKALGSSPVQAPVI